MFPIEIPSTLALGAATDVSALGAMAWLVWRHRRDAEIAIERTRRVAAEEARDLREALAAFKLEVARGYASIGYLKDVENRLTAHLLRIEAKLGHPVPNEARP
jgi:hypothetical protein